MVELSSYYTFMQENIIIIITQEKAPCEGK